MTIFVFGLKKAARMKPTLPFLIILANPDSLRIFWSDGGVHQNITFPVHPDPISGMHCWHQKVRIEPARAGDKYGDVFADTKKSMEVYRKWLALSRPATAESNGGFAATFLDETGIVPKTSGRTRLIF